MAVKISSVQKFSKSYFKGIRAGDELLSVSGHEIDDVLDFDFYMADPEAVLEIRRADGKTVKLPARGKNCGIGFETYLMDKQQRCKNKCVFCFIDQLPEGMRESLYFKDDDSRLSFLFGNYITLTNISEHEIERIISMHISPVNISVHTMNPELRVRMMKNKNAGEALKIIERFAAAGIKMNTQLVLCPGINDGAELRYSIERLASFGEAVESIAAVPVGLTKYREGLAKLEPYNKTTAAQVIDIIEEYSDSFREKYGRGIVYPADEFFIKAGRPIPEAPYYDGYPQLENGVGMARLFCDEFCAEMAEIKEKPVNKRVTLATGTDFYPFLSKLASLAEEKFGVSVNTVRVVNRFFGETITVAGLITGRDLYDSLKDEDIGDCLLLSESMISDYTNYTEHKDKFLDDMTVDELAAKLNTRIALTGSGGRLLREILGVK